MWPQGIGLGMAKVGNGMRPMALRCIRQRFTRKNGTERHRGAQCTCVLHPLRTASASLGYLHATFTRHATYKVDLLPTASASVTACAAQFLGRTRWDCPPVLSPNPTPALLPHAHCHRARTPIYTWPPCCAIFGTAARLPKQYGPTARRVSAAPACAVADIVWRAHKDRSGFDGAWTADPLKFDRACLSAPHRLEPTQSRIHRVAMRARGSYSSGPPSLDSYFRALLADNTNTLKLPSDRVRPRLPVPSPRPSPPPLAR